MLKSLMSVCSSATARISVALSSGERAGQVGCVFNVRTGHVGAPYVYAFKCVHLESGHRNHVRIQSSQPSYTHAGAMRDDSAWDSRSITASAMAVSSGVCDTKNSR